VLIYDTLTYQVLKSALDLGISYITLSSISHLSLCCMAYGMAFEIISLYSFILLTQNLTRTHCLLHNTQVDTTALYITEINGTQVVDHDLTALSLASDIN